MQKMLVVPFAICLGAFYLGCDDDDDGGGGGGVAACHDYIQAVTDCFEEAGEDASTITDAVSCDTQAASSKDYFDCLAKAYDDADCSDVMNVDFSACTP